MYPEEESSSASVLGHTSLFKYQKASAVKYNNRDYTVILTLTLKVLLSFGLLTLGGTISYLYSILAFIMQSYELFRGIKHPFNSP